jgi:hypothetical protein
MAYDKKSDIGKFQAAPGNDNTNSIDLVDKINSLNVMDVQSKSINVMDSQSKSINVMDAQSKSLDIPVKRTGFFLEDEEKSINVMDSQSKSISVMDSQTKSINISNKSTIVNMLDLERFGHNAMFHGKLGSVSIAKNANVNQSSGLIESIGEVEILDAEVDVNTSIGVVAGEYTQLELSYAKFIPQAYDSIDKAIDDIKNFKILSQSWVWMN